MPRRQRSWGASRGDVLAAEADRPGVGAQVAARSRLNSVVLPAPFGPMTPSDLAGLDRQRQIVDDPHGAERLPTPASARTSVIGRRGAA